MSLLNDTWAIKFLSLLLAVTVYATSSFSQPIFNHTTPVNFTKKLYGAGTQNWEGVQDAEGRMYFANNEGVLTYDGSRWQIFPLPNNTIVRSIAFSADGKLFAGGQDEVGYYSPNIYGSLQFTSLRPLISAEDRNFADIWNIAILGKEVFFRSTSRIFRFSNNQITVFRPSSSWTFLGLHKNNIIAQDKNTGILVFKNNAWQVLIANNSLPVGFTITAITSFQNESLITTSQHGIYKLVENQLIPIRVDGIYNNQLFTSAIALGNNDLLIGTYDNGIYHINGNGRLIESFSKSNNLQSNDVKHIYIDRQKDIWIGLDDGIAYLDLNNPIVALNPPVFNGAPGYSSAILQNTLFFALGSGIYKMPLPLLGSYTGVNNSVQKIMDGLSWNVSNVNGHLFAGREDGFFEITGQIPSTIDRSTGYWTFTLIRNDSNAMRFAAGNYLGLAFFNKQGNSFLKEVDATNLNTSCRYMEYDSLLNVIWVSHPYRGVYRIAQNGNSVKLFTSKDGLPSDLNNHVFKVNGQILLATINGVYTYNPSLQKFELSGSYNKIFNGLSLRYLKSDLKGNLWFVHEKSIGFVDNKTKTIVYLPELKGKIVSGFEHILPIDNDNILVGAEHGFFHIDYSKYIAGSYVPKVYIRNVTVKTPIDTTLYGGFAGNVALKKDLSLPHTYNAFHFEFSTPYYEQSGSVSYSYRLLGFEDKWSDWNNKTEKDYTNIAPGNYIFQVKARNNANLESEMAYYSFTITPPWYATVLAKVIYLLIGLLLLYVLWKIQQKRLLARQERKLAEERRKFLAEQKALESQHQLEIEKSEKALMQVKNEKLESEIEYKNAELASAAMNLVQKKEFLIKIKDELNKIKKLNESGTNTIETADLKKLLKSLSEQSNYDEEWEQFSYMFNKTHRDFLVTLKEKYPNLKAHELKLCAYLRMNLSSKEIAQLMSISVRGVEISRYRLRKKLEVPPKEDIFQFLYGLESGSSNKRTDMDGENPAS